MSCRRAAWYWQWACSRSRRRCSSERPVAAAQTRRRWLAPGNGKSICVTITDQVRASITTDAANSPHYLTDSVTVSNGDLGAGTTSQYVQAFSDSRCSPVPNTSFTLSCTAPKSLGPGEKTTYSPLIFRTATNSAATATNLTAVATAKEQAVAKQGKNPPTATCPLPRAIDGARRDRRVGPPERRLDLEVAERARREPPTPGR
jgi:hypothetical protein